MRGRDEHYDLEVSQFVLGEDTEFGKYIQFVERNSKTFKGGLKQRMVENKNIKHYVDESNDQNVYILYMLYIKKCITR